MRYVTHTSIGGDGLMIIMVYIYFIYLNFIEYNKKNIKIRLFRILKGIHRKIDNNKLQF